MASSTVRGDHVIDVERVKEINFLNLLQNVKILTYLLPQRNNAPSKIIPKKGPVVEPRKLRDACNNTSTVISIYYIKSILYYFHILTM